MKLDPSFPIQELTFLVAQDLTEDIRAQVEKLVVNLAAAREWVIGPPKFVDIAEGLDKSTEDTDQIPFETVGGLFEIYSATAPTVLPRDIDLRHLDEVTYLVEVVSDYSRGSHVAFEFELDGDCVGTVEDGKMTNGLRDAFLGEWKRYIEASGQ